MKAPRRRGPWPIASRAKCGVDQGGQTLVEYIVALGLISIVLAMTTIIVVTVQNSTNTTVASGQATERATYDLNDLAGYIRGAVSPNAAYEAADNLAGTDPCWGANPISPGESITADWPTADVPTPIESDSYGIIVAHDYDLEFCGYPAGSDTPQVYEISMGCPTPTPSAGYCTVSVVSYGTSYSASSDYQSPDNGTVVETIKNVWCDTVCQAQVGTPLTEGGSDAVSCSTYNAAKTYAPVGYTYTFTGTVPSSCSGAGNPTASAVNTPPLFTYYGASTPAASITDLSGAGTNQMDMASFSDADQLPTTGVNLLSIDSVRIQLTVLASNHPTTPAPDGQPGSSVSDQLYLPNLGRNPRDETTVRWRRGGVDVDDDRRPPPDNGCEGAAQRRGRAGTDHHSNRSHDRIRIDPDPGGGRDPGTGAELHLDRRPELPTGPTGGRGRACRLPELSDESDDG